MSKKLLAVVLSFVLVFSTFTAAFAEGTISADAQACATLGMLKGDTSAGVTADYIVSTPSRLQSAIIFLRLKGLEDEALAYTGTENFADANLVPWAGGRAILGYLKSNPELGWVGDQGKFDPNSALKAQDYYKVMLETLGYKQNTATVIGEFTYANVIEFAASKGLKKVATVTNYTVNDLAIATIEALKVNVKGSTKTLAASLVEASIINVQAAIAAGVYAVAPTTLAVESVTATNVRELVVKFNKAVDEDTVVVANFTIDGADAGAVSLANDNMTVTVTVATPATAQPANYELVVSNVADVAGVAMVEYTNALRIFDNAIPTVTGMKLVGPNKVELTFSEPIMTAGTVKINNGIYGVTVPAADGTNISTITLSASSLPEGNYEVKVESFKDYAGFSIDTTTKTLAYTKDVTVPVATIKEVTQTSVVVEFNKPVILDATNVGGAYEDYFYHTFSAWTPDLVVKSADNKTFTLTFTTYPIPAGTTNLAIKAKGSAGVAIADEWGNKLEANQLVAVTVAADTTAPAIKETKIVDEKTIDIFFTEAIDATEANDASNYTFKDVDGVKVTTGFTPTYVTADKKVTVVFDSKLTGGNYTVDINGMEDTSLAANAMIAVTLAFTITDKTPIDPATNAGDVVITAVESTVANGTDIIYVTYGEKMAVTGQYSVLEAGNYLLGTAALPDDTTLEMFGTSGKVVKISIPENATFNAQAVVGVNLTIGRVADLTGNTMISLSYIEAVGPEVAPAVTEVAQTDLNKITITVNKPLKVVLASGFTAGTGVNVREIAAIDSWLVNDDNETVIKATLNDVNKTSSTDTSAIIANFDVVANILVSETGVKMGLADYSGVIVDARAPKLIADNTTTTTVNEAVVDMGTALNNNKFQINFTEALNTNAALAGLMAQDLVIVKVAADGTETALVAGIGYTTVVNGSSLEVTVTAGTGDYKVKTNDAITYIKDASSNKAATFTTGIKVTVVNE